MCHLSDPRDYHNGYRNRRSRYALCRFSVPLSRTGRVPMMTSAYIHGLVHRRANLARRQGGWLNAPGPPCLPLRQHSQRRATKAAGNRRSRPDVSGVRPNCCRRPTQGGASDGRGKPQEGQPRATREKPARGSARSVWCRACPPRKCQARYRKRMSRPSPSCWP
jgi:hypothetical protein